MRRVIVRLPALLVLCASASLVWAFVEGPPTSRTDAIALGVYPAEPNCTGCHSGNALNDPNGAMEILDVPSAYTPFHHYTLRVRLRYDLADPINGDPRWGFELTAVKESDGTGAGQFVTPDPGPGPDYPDSLQIKVPSGGTFAPSGRQYIEHTQYAVRFDQGGPVEWAFDWIAPSGSAGKVYFFAAGNAADGNGTTSGDHIFTTMDSSEVGDVAAAPLPGSLSALRLAAPRPNPSRDGVRFDYALTRAGDMDLSLFDASGRRVRQLLHGARPAGEAQVAWDGRDERGTPVPAGTYFARLSMPDATPAVTRGVVRIR